MVASIGDAHMCGGFGGEFGTCFIFSPSKWIKPILKFEILCVCKNLKFKKYKYRFGVLWFGLSGGFYVFECY